MKKLITKEFSLEAAESAEGEITAYLTTYKNEDEVGDVMMPGCLDKFIKNFNPEVEKLPMLLNHNRSAIIGEWTQLESDEFGVKGKGILYTETTLGKDTHALLKRKALKSASIGFNAIEAYNKMGRGYEFNEIELFETSIVLMPANNQAEVLSVKSAEGRIETKELKTLLKEAGLDRSEIEALFNFGWKGLVNLRNTDAETEELVSAIKSFKF